MAERPVCNCIVQAKMIITCIFKLTKMDNGVAILKISNGQHWTIHRQHWTSVDIWRCILVCYGF